MKRHGLYTFYAPEAPPAGGGAAATGDAAAAAAAGGTGDKGGAAGGTGEQTPEQKAAAEQKVADDAAAAAAAADGKGDKGNKDGGAKPQPEVPDKYDLTVSDDAKAYVNDDDVKALGALAKEMKLTNEQAQAYLEQHVESVKGVSAKFLEETKADATFGGDSLEQTQRYATQALDAFAPKGDRYGDMVRTMLTKNGYGNNLGILAMLARAGKAMAEDKPGSQRGGVAPPMNKADAANTLYDHPTSQQK